MEKEFVPCTEALDLKELGFNEPCLCFYNISDDNKLAIHAQFDSYNFNMSNNKNTPNKSSRGGKLVTISAPTFSQAFKWFIEQGILSDITPHTKNIYEFYIKYNLPFSLESDTYTYSCLSNEYKTYEEAELECLKKLIEIAESK